MTTNTTINKQNKSELGMNRNDFYEYKKNRIVDLAKKGAGVAEMAQDLGMGEKDMYAFLSRNFGGIRKLKEIANSGSSIPQLKMASMTTAVATTPEKRPVGRPKKSESNNSESNSVLFAFNNALTQEKDKLLSEFKNSVEQDSQTIISEVKKGLDVVKQEMLTKFKTDIMNELSAMAKSL